MKWGSGSSFPTSDSQTGPPQALSLTQWRMAAFLKQSLLGISHLLRHIRLHTSHPHDQPLMAPFSPPLVKMKPKVLRSGGPKSSVHGEKRGPHEVITSLSTSRQSTTAVSRPTSPGEAPVPSWLGFCAGSGRNFLPCQSREGGTP